MKKLLMLLLSVIIAFGTVACGGEELRDDISYFYIIAPNNGMGITGIQDLAKKFQDANTETSFAEGKKGVIVDVEPYPDVVKVNNIRTDGKHVYINPFSVNTGMISSGDFLNVDEIVKETIPGEERSLDDKIPESYKVNLTGNSAAHGEGYYFTPTGAYMLGMNYDKKLFDDYGYYFVSPEYQDDAVVFDSDLIGKECFFADVEDDLYTEAIDADSDWNGWNSNRYLSCGPDGIYETYDDGMPSSLEELVVVCEKMKGDNIAPFVLSGKYPDNHAYVADGMLNALLKTEENMIAMKNFQASEFEIVTGYEKNSELWGQSYMSVPKTAKVPVTESQGYYTTWSAAKYYTVAFWKLAVTKGWFSKSVTTDASHIDAQADFIFSGYDANRDRSAFLIEASYWFNESTERNNFNDFDKSSYSITAAEREKEIKWFSLPREISGTVTEGNGTPEAFMYSGSGSIALYNAYYKDSPEDMAMIKAWIQFFYSDDNQKYFLKSTGMGSMLDLGDDLDTEVFNDRPFYKDLFTRQGSGVVIKGLVTSPIATAYPDYFLHHGWGTCWTDLAPVGDLDLYTGFKARGISVKEAFEKNMITRQAWGGIWQTSASDGMPATAAKDKDGNDIGYKS